MVPFIYNSTLGKAPVKIIGSETAWGRKLERGSTTKGPKSILEVIKMFSIFIMVVIAQLYTWAQTPGSVYFKRMNFTVYKLYSN